jgi:hypothetical protein
VRGANRPLGPKGNVRVGELRGGVVKWRGRNRRVDIGVAHEGPPSTQKNRGGGLIFAGKKRKGGGGGGGIDKKIAKCEN